MNTRWRSSRLYRWFLRLFPAEFRGDFGDEMTQVFDEERTEAASLGRVAVARLWVRTLAGLAEVASREHVHTLRRDAGYALRMMWNDRLSTAAIVVTLAIGVGASTAMFAVIHSVMFTLPFRDPERLVVVLRQLPHGLSAGIAPSQFEVWQRQEGAFDAIAAMWGANPILTGNGEARRITLDCISPSMFRVLGVVPAAGRGLADQDDVDGAPSTIVISHALWTRAFEGDPAAIGRTLVLDGLQSTVIGIMPSTFDGVRAREQRDGWITISDCAQRARREGRPFSFVNLYARLKPGVATSAAEAQLDASVEAGQPDAPPARVRLLPLTEQIFGDVREPFFALQGAAACVLLIGCANIASLLLGRAETRRPELAMRFALGCTRARMIRQLLTESVVLAILGGAIGLIGAYWSLDWLRSLILGWVPRVDRIEIDRNVLLACIAISTGAGLLFGLLPAWYSSQISPGRALKESSVLGSPRRRRAAAALIVVEVALSVAVLAGAGLMCRTFLYLRPVDPGFDPRGKITMTVNLPRSRYPDPESWTRFFNTLNAKLADLPGVRAVAVTSYLPLSGFISSAEVDTQGDQQSSTTLTVGAPAVSANYFSEMGITLLRGRVLTDEDRAGSAEVAVANEALARRLWPGTDPLGRQIRVKILDRWSTKTIVGLVRDTRSVGFRLNGDPEIFLPFYQNPRPLQRFVMSTSQPAESLASRVKGLVASIDQALPAGDVQSVPAITTTRAVAQWRFGSVLMGTFALMALVLAAVGLFAVVGRSVTERTSEIGVRRALGATHVDVLRLFVGRSLALTAIGLATGVALGASTTRLLSGWLVGVPPLDRVTFTSAVALMCLVCLIASFAAARRATRIDPLAVLRGE
jgi:putative ABC transport system permease protein